MLTSKLKSCTTQETKPWSKLGDTTISKYEDKLY